MRPWPATGPSSARPASRPPPCASCSATSRGRSGVPGADELLSWDGTRLGGHRGHRGRHRRRRAGLGAGDAPRLPRRHVRLAGRRAGAAHQRPEPGHVLRRRRWPGRSGVAVLHRDAGRRAAVGGDGHGVPGQAREARAPCGPSTPRRSPAARSWPARTAACSPTSRAEPRFADFMNTPARPRRRDRRPRRHGDGPGAGPASTPRWPTARSSCRGHRSSASAPSRSADATPSWASPPAGPSATRWSHRRSSRARRRCTAPTKGRSATWAPAARSVSPTRRPRVACGFVRNHLENQALPLMGACLVDVLYSCLGAREGGAGVRS